VTEDKTKREQKPITSILKNPHATRMTSDNRQFENSNASIMETHINYEGVKPSNIRSSSYAEDVRIIAAASTSSSPSVSPSNNKEEEAKENIKKVNLERSIMKFRKMLSTKFWGNKGEMVHEEEKEETYETHAVPNLSKKDREKHKKFFSQLDHGDDDDDDERVVTISPEVVSNDKRGTDALKQNDSNDKDLNKILNDAGVESFPRFLVGKMSCGYTGTGEDTIYSEDTRRK